MGRITVLGSINMDIVVTTQAHPVTGETVFGSDLDFIPGGKGANQAVAASRLIDDVRLIGKLGDDAFGKQLREFLQSENLDLTYLSINPDAPTGTALITVNSEGDNTIVVVSGVNYTITPQDVDKVDLSAGDFVVAPFEVPQEATKRLFQRAKEIGATTVLNTAPAAPFIDGLRELIDYLILNETELAHYLEIESLPDNDEVLQKSVTYWRGDIDQHIILTLGADGAKMIYKDSIKHITGQSVDVVDTTGAGDCFVGAFTVALAEGKSVADALHFANVAAALSVTKQGASASLPYRAEVDAAL